MIPHVDKALEVSLSSGASIASLVVFLLVVISVIVLVVRPTRLQLPERLQCCGLSSLLLSYAWMPVLGSLLLLACRCLTIEQLWHGIKGNEDIKPYAIVILFMSLAYMSYSLDSTGGLSWVALHITARSRGNGRALFIFYFLLSGVMTTITSNDIVIMTFTPIILHFAKATGTAPLPFLVAMFSSANLWSMMLIIGNPTNIIAGDAFNMTFLEYSKWMALPTLISGFIMLGMLFWRFHRQIPKAVQLPDMHPSHMLRDPLAAAVGAVLLLSCIAMLAAAPYLGWELWPVTLIFAAAHTAFNFVTMVLLKRGPAASRHSRADAQAADDSTITQHAADAGAYAPPGTGASAAALLHADSSAHAAEHAYADDGGSVTLRILAGPLASGNAELQLRDITAADKAGTCLDSCQHQPASRQQRASSAASSQQELDPASPEDALVQEEEHQHELGFLDVWMHLPWEIIPFVFGMFVMVESLAVNGWVDALAAALARASTSTPATLFLFATVSVVLANVINNQPMTILMTRVCLSSAFSNVVSSKSLLGALFSVVAASNLGANVSMIGALAGIMWASILRKKGLHVSYLEFTQVVSPPGIVCIVVAVLVLWAELEMF